MCYSGDPDKTDVGPPSARRTNCHEMIKVACSGKRLQSAVEGDRLVMMIFVYDHTIDNMLIICKLYYLVYNKVYYIFSNIYFRL